VKKRLADIEKEMSKPGVWDRPEEMTPLMREKSRLEDRSGRFDGLFTAKCDVDEWLVLAQEDQSAEALSALAEHLDILAARLKDTEMSTLLSEPEDKNSAIMVVHPGAGGMEAQDWAEMLLRMYRRWAERKSYAFELMDYLAGEGAGVKSATIRIAGPYAYGFLKGEAGIHRLVRISPFDASGRRHTSFASVDVWPDAEEDIDITVRDEDVRIDVFRASGPGGQHVNKTNSAVRITHLETNLVVQCQNEKSQLKNKELAFKILKARLYDLEVKKREASKKADYSTKDAIAWGSQIRSYVLQPYRLIKDHRSSTESGNVDAVLDGDLDDFIRGYLLFAHTEKKE
jgi:peptide chain release factor 2